MCGFLFLCGPVVRDVLFHLRYAIAPTTPYEEHAGKKVCRHSERTSLIGVVSLIVLVFELALDTAFPLALYPGPGVYGFFIAFAYI